LILPGKLTFMQPNGLRYYQLTPNEIWQQVMVIDVTQNFTEYPTPSPPPDNPDPSTLIFRPCQFLYDDEDPVYLLPDNTIVLICTRYDTDFYQTRSIIFLKGVGHTYYPFREYLLDPKAEGFLGLPFTSLIFNFDHNWVISMPKNILIDLHCNEQTKASDDCLGNWEGEWRGELEEQKGVEESDRGLPDLDFGDCERCPQACTWNGNISECSCYPGFEGPDCRGTIFFTYHDPCYPFHPSQALQPTVDHPTPVCVPLRLSSPPTPDHPDSGLCPQPSQSSQIPSL
jgi:hypothetical protein